MDLATAHRLWDAWTAAYPQRAHKVKKANNPADPSLYAEYLAGAFLLGEQAEIDGCEFFGDRVLSPRRRDRSKTCDFVLSFPEAESSPVFVEVKHRALADGEALDYASFLKSAHLKGARWLVLVIYRTEPHLARELVVEEIEASAWSEYVSAKQVLKFRRNGLVRLLSLTIS